MSKTKRPQVNSARPPIVVVVGHVDHGKTTLLDTIRKTNIAAKEHGGITQHIGAYQVSIPSLSEEKVPFKITFIDTPGHEAFAKMRSRGASVADLAVLVVAADDSVKPQTIEAIKHIKDANIPMIVAVNKIDLPSANIERVKKDLAKNEVQVEGFGGDVPIVQISAKTNKGITELLDMIQLVTGVLDLTKKQVNFDQAVVIESKMEKSRGIVVSVIVLSGTFLFGKELFAGSRKVGKIKAMFDEFGNPVAQAGSGKPVEILGCTEFPEVGGVLTLTPQHTEVQNQPQKIPEIDSMPDFLKPMDEQTKKLSLVLKADTAGTLEAIILSIGDRLEIASRGIGNISDNDIKFAKSTGSFVIGFNIKCETSADKLSQTEKVIYRTYNVIYDLLDDLNEAIENSEEVLKVERELGKGVIVAEFPYDGERVAGVKVLSGRLSRGDLVKIVRNETEIGRVKVKSMRHGKSEVNKIEIGKECGILFDRKFDFKINDAIIALS